MSKKRVKRTQRKGVDVKATTEKVHFEDPFFEETDEESSDYSTTSSTKLTSTTSSGLETPSTEKTNTDENSPHKRILKREKRVPRTERRATQTYDKIDEEKRPLPKDEYPKKTSISARSSYIMPPGGTLSSLPDFIEFKKGLENIILEESNEFNNDDGGVGSEEEGSSEEAVTAAQSPSAAVKFSPLLPKSSEVAPWEDFEAPISQQRSESLTNSKTPNSPNNLTPLTTTGLNDSISKASPVENEATEDLQNMIKKLSAENFAAVSPTLLQEEFSLTSPIEVTNEIHEQLNSILESLPQIYSIISSTKKNDQTQFIYNFDSETSSIMSKFDIINRNISIIHQSCQESVDSYNILKEVYDEVARDVCHKEKLLHTLKADEKIEAVSIQLQQQTDKIQELETQLKKQKQTSEKEIKSWQKKTYEMEKLYPNLVDAMREIIIVLQDDLDKVQHE